MPTTALANTITREEALKLCPNYVAFAEGNFDHFDAILSGFEKAKKGQAAITATDHDGKQVFVRVKISSVVNDGRNEDGPTVRVSNGEYSWRVDGSKYAHIL